MKVLIISNMYPSPSNPGYGSFVLEQAQSLTARGVDCVVVASSESRKGFRYVIPKYLRLIRDTLLAVLKDNFDIIHAHYIFPTAIIGYLASKIRNSILIVTVHGSIEPLSTSFLSRKIIEFSLHKSSHIITVGTSVSNEIIKDYSIDRSKISLIDMGVDTELFNSMAKQEARINLGLPLEKKILICIGNLIWRKGFHILLNSIARYPPIFRSTITIIIGHGPIYDILQDYVNEKDLSDQVHFAGVVNKKQIPLWLSAADCLVHPALDEPFGLVIVEAMSCQKIVVASPVGGVKDYLEDGINGFLINPWECGVRSQWEGWIDSNYIEALANKIDYAISIPEAHRDLICKRARTTAEGHDIHLQANKVKRLYSDLASGKM